MNDTTGQVHFRIDTQADNIVWLHFDKAGAGTNVLSIEVLKELDRHLQTIRTQNPRGLVILSDKKNGFIAGADIEEFTRIKNKDQALELIKLGQSVFNHLADLTFPTVALILVSVSAVVPNCRWPVATVWHVMTPARAWVYRKCGSAFIPALAAVYASHRWSAVSRPWT